MPIVFSVANAENDGEYFDGIVPDCVSEDDISHIFGNEEENSLETALYYIENGVCPSIPENTVARKRSVHSSKEENLNELKGLRREIGAY